MSEDRGWDLERDKGDRNKERERDERRVTEE